MTSKWAVSVVMVLSAATIVSILAAGAAGAVPTMAWIDQIGGPETDEGTSVSADGMGSVYLGGHSPSDLGTGKTGTDSDAFLAKYDSAGNPVWLRQIGTPGYEASYGVSADPLGGIYMTGKTSGSLGGTYLGGSYDGFLVKYNQSGVLQWSRQIGTTAYDACYGVSSDASGNAYAIGHTQGSLGGQNIGGWDAFVTKYDPQGNLLWARQVGTASTDAGGGVSVDGTGHVYLSGRTEGSLGGANQGGSDAFVTRFDAAGNLLWTRQFGTSGEEGEVTVAADTQGYAYVAGYTRGSLGGSFAGVRDAFLTKFDPAGNMLWSRQLGTSGDDVALGVKTDMAGNVYIAGGTGGSLGGPAAGGEYDAFVSKFDAAGNLLWTFQVGTSATETSHSVSVDDLGGIYFSGNAYGSLGGPFAGVTDAYVAKLIPEPATLTLLAMGSLAVLKPRK